MQLEKTYAGDPLIGQTLGEYKVIELMARGGMAVVYRGEQPHIGKKVAIKVLLPDMAADDEMVHRLLEEARSVNQVRHHNLINIYGFGQLPDGRHYYVMEYLEGQSLEQLLAERGQLSLAETLSVLEQVLDGLGAAHGAGVVHRDLKPGNVFVTTLADGSWQVKVLDFGIAKRLDSSYRTATNVILGTPGYMAPEQIRGKPVSPSTDLYALGVMAFRMLTGREPFAAPTPVEVMQRHLTEVAIPPSQLQPELPPMVDALVGTLLLKEMGERPRSAAEVRQRLGPIRMLLPRSTTLQVPRVTMGELATPLPSLKQGRATNSRGAVSSGRKPAADTASGPLPVAVPRAAVVTEGDRELLAAAAPATTRQLAVTAAAPSRWWTVGLVLLGVLGGIAGTAIVLWPKDPETVTPTTPSRPLDQPRPLDPPPRAPVVTALPDESVKGPVAPVAPVAPVVERPPAEAGEGVRPNRPPRAPQKSRDEVWAELQVLRTRARNANSAVRQLVTPELDALEKRLEGGERPAQIEREANELAKQSGLGR